MNTYLIPYWLLSVIRNKKINVADFFNYSIVSNVLSDTDIIDLFSLQSLQYSDALKENQQDFLIALLGNNYNDFSFSSSLTDDNLKSQFNKRVLPFLRNTNIMENIVNRLRSTDAVSLEPKYQIRIDGGNIVVIIRNGFFELLDDRREQLNMLREYILKLESLSPPNKISLTCSFKHYLKLL